MAPRNGEARKSFEHTLAQIVYERTGKRWKVELKQPADLPVDRGEG
jgi:hypothetical protein